MLMAILLQNAQVCTHNKHEGRSSILQLFWLNIDDEAMEEEFISKRNVSHDENFKFEILPSEPATAKMF